MLIREKPRKHYVAKEPMSITAVGVYDIAEQEFETSHFWEKLEHMLIIYYYQTDYLKEVMFNAWFDRAQKLKKNDIFDMLCAGCLGYIRPLKQGEVILANTNSYIISFDSTMEKYIHIVRPDNIKLIQKFKNKI